MGHLDSPENTFWELFLRPAGSRSWVLRTPPGVASNGGLVLAASPSGQWTAGFLISALLKFSPLAQSTDGGADWSPGELPFPLTPAPDALAVGSTGHVLALVSPGGRRVLQASGDLAAWRTVTTTHALTQAASSCGVQAVTAVAYNPAGQPLLGLSCAHRGHVGDSHDYRDIHLARHRPVARERCHLGGPSREHGHRGRRPGAGAVGDAGVGRGILGQRVDRPVGRIGHPLHSGRLDGQGDRDRRGLRSGARRAVGVGGRADASRSSPARAPPGSPSRRRRGVPSAVSDLGTEVDTFVVASSHLAVWAWSDGAAGWSRSASITVPVPYGSSG